MAENDEPSVETLYVGTMMAFIAMQAVAIGLASRLADVPENLRDHVESRVPLPDYRSLIGKSVADAADAVGTDLRVTDLEPGQFDGDQAQAIALDMVRRSGELVGMVAGPRK
jgi:hypothetical protein